jgi:hypothetical protein
MSGAGGPTPASRLLVRLVPWLCGVSLLVCIPLYGQLQAAHLVWTDRCQESSSSCEGSVLELGLVKVVGVEAEGYTVASGHRLFAVEAETPAGAVGDTVSFRAEYRRGRLVQSAATRHPDRNLKAYLGVLGLLLLIPFGRQYWEQLRGRHA